MNASVSTASYPYESAGLFLWEYLFTVLRSTLPYSGSVIWLRSRYWENSAHLECNRSKVCSENGARPFPCCRQNGETCARMKCTFGVLGQPWVKHRPIRFSVLSRDAHMWNFSVCISSTSWFLRWQVHYGGILTVAKKNRKFFQTTVTAVTLKVGELLFEGFLDHPISFHMKGSPKV